jgi:hypothetical protein
MGQKHALVAALLRVCNAPMNRRSGSTVGKPTFTPERRQCGGKLT